MADIIALLAAIFIFMHRVQNDLPALHALHQLRRIRRPTLFRIINLFDSALVCLRASVKELCARGVSEDLARRFFDECRGVDIERCWTALEQDAMATGVRILTRDDPHYPEQLYDMNEPPHLLYYRGESELLRTPRLLSIVGARKATHYGKEVVREAVRELVARGVYATVSGLAFGIDAAVHEATLDAHGKTIAVLGSSVLPQEIMPSRNQRLAERIIENGGVVISEYPPGYPVRTWHFPERNRIIAGVSAGTLVVEASEKSGALITARYALESQRDVYAVPGSIFSPVSRGTNQLIADGAHPWLSCRSLIGELEYPHEQLTLTALTSSVSTEERALLAACTAEPLTVDELIERTGYSASTVLTLVTTLQLKELIRIYDGERYHAVSRGGA